MVPSLLEMPVVVKSIKARVVLRGVWANTIEAVNAATRKNNVNFRMVVPRYVLLVF